MFIEAEYMMVVARTVVIPIARGRPETTSILCCWQRLGLAVATISIREHVVVLFRIAGLILVHTSSCWTASSKDLIISRVMRESVLSCASSSMIRKRLDIVLGLDSHHTRSDNDIAFRRVPGGLVCAA